jgi:flagellar hook-associated protein 2
MGTGIGIGGLASGVQWRDLVESIITAERARNIGRLETQVSDAGRRKTQWQEFEKLVRRLDETANALRAGTAWRGFGASVSPSPSGRTLFAATASSAATPGAYSVEVVDLARAAKVSGGVVSDPATALGRAGTFQVAGQTVTVAAGDSLNQVRDRINALNTGGTPTRVSASVLTSATGASRLILSADQAGSGGIPLVDGPEGTLRDLGFLDSRSRTVSPATQAIAAALGVNMPPPSTIKVGDRTIAVDLTTDSLSSIAARIRAAGVQAEVQAETSGGTTQFRLSIGASVTATEDPNSAANIAALGITEGTRSTVKQVVATGGSFTDAGGATATGSTLLTALRRDGTAMNLQVGDAINVTGTRGDGSAVTVGLTVGASDTLDTLLARLNDPVSGFGGGARPASASIGPDGRLRLEDGTGGDSRLSLAFSVAPVAGGPAAPAFGPTAVETTGRARELVRGSDAQVRVDGVLVTRPSNTIGDALPGVTLSLQQAEPGTTVDLTVSRDQEASLKAVRDFVSAYNDVVSFQNGQQVEGQPLALDSTLRRIVSSFTGALRTEVDAAGAFDRGTLVGMTLSRTGRLELDEAKLRTVMSTDLPALETLFGATGIGGAMRTATQEATRFGTGTISSQISSIDNSTGRTRSRISVLQQRLDERREALIRQFTAMEQSLSQLQSQGNQLASAVAGLRGSSR